VRPVLVTAPASFPLSYPITPEVRAACARFPEIAKAVEIPPAGRSELEIVRLLDNTMLWRSLSRSSNRCPSPTPAGWRGTPTGNYGPMTLKPRAYTLEAASSAVSPSPAWSGCVGHREQQELYARMRDQYGDVAFVTLDRRETERRCRRVPVGVERRLVDRREPWTAGEMERCRRLGYRLLYRAKGVEMDPGSNAPLS
jgi:hypothetical protein